MLSVVVPAHNEERSLPALTAELTAALGALGRPWEIVVVDDGSTDGTFATLTRLRAEQPALRVVRLRRNFGKAAALAAGFEHARGDVIVTLDGDGQDDPAEIPRLVAKLDEGFDLVSGWKARRRDPLARRLLSRIYNAVTGWVSGVRLHDMNCGLKAYRGEVARGLHLYGELHRFIPVLAHYEGFSVAEVPVNHRPREHGRSRYGPERYLRGFFDLLTVTFMGRYRYRPLHLFGGLGLLLGTARLRRARLPDRPEDRRGRDRAPPAPDARRAAGRRGPPALLPRPDRRAASRASTSSAGERASTPTPTWTRSCAKRVRVLLFGTYQRDYPRNAVTLAALRRAGVEVVEHNVPVWNGDGELGRRRASGAAARRGRGASAAAQPVGSLRRRPRRLPGPRRPPGGAARGQRGARRLRRARLPGGHVRRRPRALLPRLRCRRRALAAIDRFALRAADLVVADTEANAGFLCPLAGLPRERLAVVPVGAEERLFRPGWEPRDPPLFVGKLIPLHGLETILEAARLAPDLRLRVAGSASSRPSSPSGPGTSSGSRGSPTPSCRTRCARASCALGIFGTSDKARRVIPNKAYQALACGVPLVTADTPAARELLVDGESALLVPPGDAAALVAALRRLRDEDGLAERIGAGGLTAFRRHASEDVLGRRWRGLLERLAR